MMENAISDLPNGVAERIAQRTLAKRGAGYASEVRRLLDAALEVMRQCGTASRPRVADIVAAAGLSNDAFYRHFPSKDALVAALLEDGAERLTSYVAHQMDKESTPEGKICQWVEGILSQTREEIASTTLAVLGNAGSLGEGLASDRHSASAPLAALLREPFAELGSADPAMDASLVAHATVGKISDYLWQRVSPTRADVDHIIEFCLRAITPRPNSTTRERP
ncbi:TetR/AcrR family transcriptional regulator [Frankia sp. Cr2]|uniref:TetR/AcrR family transcriptional regulator n=1 Tax=Frankia sp. Cr2 TaxID=3073932 RepID=UPI002AD25209|nr:TetR/AcrR family transcriptional regulator [Frankia sp. Cr2]